MATPPANTTPLGQRMIARYLAGSATYEQLVAAYDKGWISTVDYENALEAGHGSLSSNDVGTV